MAETVKQILMSAKTKESTRLKNWSAMIGKWENSKIENKKGIDQIKKLMIMFKGKL